MEAVAHLDPDLLIDFTSVSIRRNGHTLVGPVTWQVELDERWVILGPNGAGKTSLLQIAAAENHPSHGTAYVLGERLGRTDISELRPRIGLSSAALAARVVDLLDKAGLAPCTMGRRGYDHGAWNAMMLAFPDADIPIVQVSIDPNRDAGWHYRLGQALAPLREEGILLVGSGHITHNLRAIFPVLRQGAEPDPDLVAKFGAFVDWFAEEIEAGDVETLLDWKNRAPFPRDNHPTDEHLMPLFFALGAAGDHPHGRRVHESRQHGLFAFDSYLFD